MNCPQEIANLVNFGTKKKEGAFITINERQNADEIKGEFYERIY